MASSRSELAGCALVVMSLLVVAPAPASGDRNDENDALKKARAEFVVATDHVRSSRWGEALAAFERSAALRGHALTTYNIGACERALGRYTRARVAFERSLEADQRANKRELPPSFADDATRWLAEIDAILVRATVTLSPADAVLLVDGAPLAPGEGGALVAGLPPAERLVRTPGPTFKLVVDPGTHLFALSRRGFANAVISKSFAPGTAPDVQLDLESLPATIRITADRPGAAVALDDVDTGVAPVEVSRPAGSYQVAVKKSGFVPYFTTVRVSAGDRPTLHATLAEETTPLTKKFWFWAAASTVVAGAAATTYLLTRPAPERPNPDGGGLGWVVTVPAPGAR